MNQNLQSPYEALGGAKEIEALVDTFYSYVSQHPDLIPIFPSDLTETARKQKQFLTQYFGGPPLYTSEHGHPMLRARHLPFTITPKRRDAWLSCMHHALDDRGIEGPLRDFIWDRLRLTAEHMTNSPDEMSEDHD
ncbi:globin [Ectobacillus antri]|uniref:Globin n=1 Tax=Ectobacillus antri TaxID=2486280 RepID=A0ABT6H595_9BACI|nr:globin [Ectobacillus antri]MDG4656639.1 globin [Ectobacillus antri]MDG5753998.1 globin [Ectobacillus antri]